VTEYRTERGLMWPASDKNAAAVLFAQAGDVEKVYPHVAKFGVAVQAGGNCGLWPRELGKKFSTVYTFEPDPVNFRCLCANAPDEHIFKFNAALGNERGLVSLNLRPDNVGAHSVSGGGIIPSMRIDDLELNECDLIYLDVEGFEE
jgi:FkbM family methyltransferase